MRGGSPSSRVARAAAVVATMVALLVAPALPATAAGGDPLLSQQYGPQQINAPAAWGASTGRGVIIAIVDTGVDLQHPDLVGKLVPGIDMVDDDGVPQDEHGHGTHVAGIAAAMTNNGQGIAGVAPDARIMPVRVLDANGSGDGKTVSDGIRWAVDHGARVVNLSLSGQVTLLDALFGNALETAIAYAWSKGAVVVAASGNLEAAGSGQPSGYSKGVKAIVVTATDRDRHHPNWANRADTDWSVAAPGDAVLSTLPGGKYGAMSGTSMSAPHVSATAALLLAQGLDNDQVVQRILSTAHPLGARSSDGAGLIDVAAAVGAPVKAAATPTAAPAPASPGATPARPSTSTPPRRVAPGASPDAGAPTPSSSLTPPGLPLSAPTPVTPGDPPELPAAPAPELVPLGELAAPGAAGAPVQRGVPIGMAAVLLGAVLLAFTASWRRGW